VQRDSLVGGVYAAAAFGWWGLVPLYWRTVRFVPGLELVGHRVVWSLPVLLIVVLRRRRLREVVAALRDPGHRALLAVTAALVSLNWLVFLWAVESDHVLEASLGYFVNPLVNVALGVVFLHERLRRRQGWAVALAAVGVTYLAIALGAVPWISLVLALTFGTYGLLRKQAGVDGLVGLHVEVVLLVPVAVAWLAWRTARGESEFLAQGWASAARIAASGLVTALPLLWFANAARRLRYTTLGFFQYLAPTGQFLLAVLAFGEAFTRAHAVAFGLIWTAVALYLVDAVRASRAERRRR